MSTIRMTGSAIALALAFLLFSATAQGAPSGRLARASSKPPAAKPASKPPPAKTTEPAKTDAKPADDKPANLAAFKAGSEPDGFRGVKWGAAFSDFSGMKDSSDGDMNGHKVKTYTKTGDDPSFIGLRSDEISYIFSDDKFYGIGLDFKKIDDARWDDIVKTLMAQYGQVPELRLDNQPCYIWWGDKSFVRIKRYTDWCFVDIWSKYFFGDSADQDSVLTRALNLGDMPRIKKIIEADPSIINKPDDDGKTPLFWTLECHPKDGGEQIMEYLISKGADVNHKAKDGATPLQKACELHDLSMVKLLVSKGADVNMAGSDGQTPLLAAYARTDIAEFLISKGADVKARETKYGKTVLHHAALEGATELVKLLISKGADLNAKDNDGCTPLFLATEMHDQTETVQALLDGGADLNARDTKDGMTALHDAAEHGATNVVKLLLSKGADVNVRDDDNRTPLHWAVGLFGSIDTVKLLIDKGADINAKEKKHGATVLHWAVDEYNLEAVQFLLDHGADVNAKDDNGNTPLQYAIDDKQDKIADLIRQHGGTQ